MSVSVAAKRPEHIFARPKAHARFMRAAFCAQGRPRRLGCRHRRGMRQLRPWAPTRVWTRTPRGLRPERAAALREELREERAWGASALLRRRREVPQEHVATREPARTLCTSSAQRRADLI